MLQLIYTSDAAVPLSMSDLVLLVHKSRKRNEASDVTSLLLHHNQTYLQALEGPEAAVEATFERISADPRHRWLRVLCRSSISCRVFGNWSLGFVQDPSGLVNAVPEFADLFAAKGPPAKKHGIAAVKLLTEFRFGKWRRRVDTGAALIGAGVGLREAPAA